MPAEPQAALGEPVVKLGEQLKELREEWGEGFDEDIAQPIARWLKKIREQLKADAEANERQIEDLHDQVADAEHERSRWRDEAGRYTDILEELADVGRGIRTIEEVLDAYVPVP